MKLLRTTSLFLIRVAVYLRTLYEVLDERRRMRELVRVLENCAEHLETENPSPAVADNLEGWVDRVYETLCRKMETKE